MSCTFANPQYGGCDKKKCCCAGTARVSKAQYGCGGSVSKAQYGCGGSVSKAQYGCGGSVSKAQYGCGGIASGQYGGGARSISRSAKTLDRIQKVFGNKKRVVASRKRKLASSKRKRVLRSDGDGFFLRASKIPPETKKYCSCIMKVAQKQSPACLKHIAAGGNARDIAGCYNPYAICGRIKPKGVKGCATLYDFENIPKDHVKAFAELKGKSMAKLLNEAAAEIQALKR